MTPPERATPAVAPLDAERARLRAAGLTDDEISRIFVARELGASQQQAGTSAGAATGQAPMSGVMGNVSAVWAHVRGIIPAIAVQIMTVGSSSAASSVRLAAFLSLMVKATLLILFAYVVSLELSQLRSATYTAHVQSCLERQRFSGIGRPAYIDNLTESQKQRFREEDEKIKRDCE